MSDHPRAITLDSNLRQRLVTSAIALPPVLVSILLGGVPFAILIGLVALLALLEIWVMLRSRPIYVCLSLFYVVLPLILLIWMRQMVQGVFWVAAVVTLTWVTDIFAYIGGRVIGRTPLSPAVSPHKTVEGALTGWTAGGLAMVAVLAIAGALDGVTIWLALIGPWMSILGDLFESAIKRRFAIKDSHLPGLDILPGHGGMLDRIDGLLFVSAFCAVFAALGVM
ncbi:MAG: phosphatidate cytidylyltransferase [Chloroflexota bacterium]|nr:phosphatidate cytidylyltransferase [Chloroflexota bacterium]